MGNEYNPYDVRIISIFDELENRTDMELDDIYLYVEYLLEQRKVKKRVKELRRNYGEE